MTPHRQLRPQVLKDLLVLDGWVMRREDEYNWVLSKPGKDYVVVPKKVRTVPFEAMERCLAEADITGQRYLDLIEEAERSLAEEPH